MSNPVRYQVWQHVRSKELWAIRLEHDVLTGAFGPLLEHPRRVEDLVDITYEDHPDDLEWIVRATDYFVLVDPSPFRLGVPSLAPPIRALLSRPEGN
jgi:hypothetical protein